MAIFLVFTVLLMEFRSFCEPVAIVFGAVLAMFGTVAWGIGSGAAMLRPLAIAVIGALCVSILFSLIATPTVYYLMLRLRMKPELQKLVPLE